MNIVKGNKYIWQCPEVDTARALSLASAYSLSIPVAQIVLSRGFSDDEAIRRYLFTSADEVAHPSLLKGADAAVERIMQALEKQEKILIAGDYDVDGITSSSLMLMCLKPLGANINFFLPHRVKDGYGLSVKTVERAAENNYKLIITVDNGITAFDAAQRAHELGIDLIITDHHRPHGHLPKALAIVNPNQDDCAYPYKKFAGVGVGFKLMTLLYERLGKKELPSKAYELLLLGTVADVVPLTGENRYWVRNGLSYIAEQESFSLTVLKQNGKVQKPVMSATDIGFSITPQINALGRLEDPRQGVKFLIGTNQDEIRQVGTVLYELNESRKLIERTIFNEIKERVEAGAIDIAKERVIIAASNNWPPGVIGLVASRVVSAYGRPTILLHLDKNGLAKGSCRSIAPFNMFDALASCADILKNFGGHSLAAGLALAQKDLDMLKARLEERAAALLTVDDLVQKIMLDSEITLSDVNKKLMQDIAYLEPFGNENPRPAFWVRQVSLVNPPLLLKDAHVKCTVFAEGSMKPVIFFNRPELFELLLAWGDKPFDMAVEVTENHWQDRVSIELVGLDIALECKR